MQIAIREAEEEYQFEYVRGLEYAFSGVLAKDWIPKFGGSGWGYHWSTTRVHFIWAGRI
jgi:hypothetical protein